MAHFFNDGYTKLSVMKTIATSVLLLCFTTVFSQDTIVRKDKINLPTVPVMNRSNTAGAPGQDGGQPTDTTKQGPLYCIDLVDGKLVLKKDGVITNRTITFSNGTTINTAAVLKRKTGTRIQLKNGDCVNSDGTIR